MNRRRVVHQKLYYRFICYNIVQTFCVKPLRNNNKDYLISATSAINSHLLSLSSFDKELLTKKSVLHTCDKLTIFLETFKNKNITKVFFRSVRSINFQVTVVQKFNSFVKWKLNRSELKVKNCEILKKISILTIEFAE